MNNSKKCKLTESEKKDKIASALLRKKECEKRSLDIVARNSLLPEYLFYKIDQTLESFFRQNHSPACFRALLSDLLEKQEILSNTEINVLLKRLTNEKYYLERSFLRGVFVFLRRISGFQSIMKIPTFSRTTWCFDA